MLFGSIKKNKTYVAAASRTEELKVFGEYAQTLNSPLFNEVHKPDFIELMQNEDLAGYSIAYVFEHKNEEQAAEFCNSFNVNIVHPKELKDLHDDMLTASDENVDPYGPDADRREIGEIYNIAESDPWDNRTPEEIEQAKRNQMNPLQQGAVSGEAFASPLERKNKKGVAATDIQAELDEHGNPIIKHATYVKLGGDEAVEKSSEPVEMGGIYADFTGHDRKKRFSANVPEVDTLSDDVVLYIVESSLITRQMVFETNSTRHKNSGAYVFFNDTNWAIVLEARDAAKLQKFIELAGHKAEIFPVNKKGELNVTAKTEYDDTHDALVTNLGSNNEIFYRVDVSKKFINAMYMLSATMDILMKDDLLYEKIHYTGLFDKGGWITSRRMFSVEQIGTRLKESGFTVSDSYAVNDWGDRLIEDGTVEFVDPNAVPTEPPPPRPWNGRMEEFLALGGGDENKAWKKIKGKELIFCSMHQGTNDGTLVYITPAEYFAEHKEAWDGNLKIEHLLSQDMKAVPDSANTYRSRNREEAKITTELQNKGLIEHLLFNLYINNIL